MMRHGVKRAVAVVMVAAAAACSGADTAPASPSSPAAATVTITASGANPRSVTVAPGSQVLFINNDTRQHQMYSDPHPEHTSCPEFDQVGALSPGQSRATGNLNVARTCAFHDHLNFEAVALRGSVVIR
jgi:plastocyanin